MRCNHADDRVNAREGEESNDLFDIRFLVIHVGSFADARSAASGNDGGRIAGDPSAVSGRRIEAERWTNVLHGREVNAWMAWGNHEQKQPDHRNGRQDRQKHEQRVGVPNHWSAVFLSDK